MELDGDEARELAEACCRARELNVGRSHWLSKLPGGGTATFWCECSDETCAGLVSVSGDDWARARSDAGCFLVLPGHVDERIAEVVADGDGFCTMQITDPRALEVARAQDPFAEGVG